jgi:hypothetical protein
MSGSSAGPRSYNQTPIPRKYAHSNRRFSIDWTWSYPWDDTKSIRVLSKQSSDMSRPHPFTEAGNIEFNNFLWMPPNGTRAGDILLADSTIFTTLFDGVESLETFWRNLAMTPLSMMAHA